MSLFVKQSLQNENALSLNTNKAVLTNEAQPPSHLWTQTGISNCKWKRGLVDTNRFDASSVPWRREGPLARTGGSFSNTFRGSFANTEHFRIHFYCQGHHFGPQEAEGHFQTHARGHFQTGRQNPGAISNTGIFSRGRKQHFNDVYNVFSMYMHLLGSNWGAQCHPRQQIRPY